MSSVIRLKRRWKWSNVAGQGRIEVRVAPFLPEGTAMNLLRFRFVAFIIAITLMLFPAFTRAHADAYQIFDLGTGHLRSVSGIESSGAVIISTDVGICIATSGCWDTWVNGVDVSEVTTKPNPGYDDGTACSPSAPSIFAGDILAAACNNGREVYGADK